MKEETAIVRAKKIGGSIMVTIPSQITKLKQIGGDELLEIRVRKRKIDGFGALKGIGSYDREEDRMKDRI